MDIDTGIVWQSDTCDCRALVGDGYVVEYACTEHAAPDTLQDAE